MPNNEMFRIRHRVAMSADNPEEAEMMLYGEIVLSDDWKSSNDDRSAADFARDMRAIKGAKRLTLRMNCPGGYVTEAMAMRSILADAGFEAVNIRIEGICASAATLIATIPGAHVSIAEGSRYMIHNPYALVIGNADELEKEIAYLRTDEAEARGFYARKTGQSDEQLKAWMDAETWFTAEEAVRNGFCDEVIRAEIAAPGSDVRMSTHAMHVMHALYHHAPELPTSDVSNGEAAPEASATEDRTRITRKEEENRMENETSTAELTQEQLQTQNPALYQSVVDSALALERERVQDIDDLTPPGYEQMAAEAKRTGMSAMDFHKQIIQAQRQKGADYMASRRAETAPAKEVLGMNADEETGQDNEQRELEAFAAQMNAYAKGCTPNETMY